MPELTFTDKLNIRMQYKKETNMKPMLGGGVGFSTLYVEWLENKVKEAEKKAKTNPSIH